MKSVDVYLSYKIRYPSSIVIMQFGNFYEVFDKDTIIMNILFNYKIRKIGNVDRVGFPLGSLYKVINILNKNKINYVVVDTVDNKKFLSIKKTHKKNNYNKFSKQSINIVEVNKRIENIYNILKNKDQDEVMGILESIESII